MIKICQYDPHYLPLARHKLTPCSVPSNISYYRSIQRPEAWTWCEYHASVMTDGMVGYLQKISDDEYIIMGVMDG